MEEFSVEVGGNVLSAYSFIYYISIDNRQNNVICQVSLAEDARLIAAAPELLALSKALLAVVDNDTHLKAMLNVGDIGMINDALMMARKVIAKAEGRD